MRPICVALLVMASASGFGCDSATPEDAPQAPTPPASPSADVAPTVAPPPTPHSPVFPVPAEAANTIHVEQIADGIAWAEPSALAAVGFELAQNNLRLGQGAQGRWSIESVAENSTAAGIGLNAGDVLVAGNGVAFTDVESMRLGFMRAVEAGRFALEIERGEKPVRIEVVIGRGRVPSERELQQLLLLMLRSGVRILDESRCTVDVRAIEALAKFAPALDQAALFESLGVPPKSKVKAVSGAESITSEDPKIAITQVGEARAFEIAVESRDHRMRVLQYEVIPDLLDADALDRLLPRLQKPVTRRVPGRVRSAEEQSIVDSIECDSEGRCTYERGALEKALADPSILARSARVIPSHKDGAVVGFKLFAIRSGTLLHTLGFKNGDTILSVNGHAIASPKAALEAYGKVREAKKLVFEIERRREKKTLTFTER